MELSEIIGIADITVTLLIGFWLTRYLGNRDARSRVLKDYYIEEAKDLQNDVRTFFARLLSNHVPGSELSRWHKSHMNKFKSFDDNIRHSFHIECPFVNKELFKIHSEITNLEEFNNGFTTGFFNFSPNNRARINEFECSALTLLDDYVVQINKSPGLGYLNTTYNNIKHEYIYYIKKIKCRKCYFFLWLWRIFKLVIILLLTATILFFCRKIYAFYAHQKQQEKVKIQKNFDKAIEIINVHNAKLDSINLELRKIKNNMKVRKGINNYWIHTKCNDQKSEIPNDKN